MLCVCFESHELTTEECQPIIHFWNFHVEFTTCHGQLGRIYLGSLRALDSKFEIFVCSAFVWANSYIAIIFHGKYFRSPWSVGGKLTAKFSRLKLAVCQLWQLGKRRAWVCPNEVASFAMPPSAMPQVLIRAPLRPTLPAHSMRSPPRKRSWCPHEGRREG